MKYLINANTNLRNIFVNYKLNMSFIPKKNNNIAF